MNKILPIITSIVLIIFFTERASSMNNISINQAYAIAQTSLDGLKGIPQFEFDRKYTEDLGYGWLFLLSLKDKTDKGWFGTPLYIVVTKDEALPYVIYPINAKSENIRAQVNNDRKRRNVPPVESEPEPDSRPN